MPGNQIERRGPLQRPVSGPGHRPVLAIIAFVAALTGGVPGSAEAQTICGKRALIVNSLDVKFAEKPVSIGLARSGGVIEVFASRHGSWTIILTLPNGQSCLLASGEGWENLPKLADGPRI